MWDKKRKVVNDLAIIDTLLIHHSAGSHNIGLQPEEVFDALNRTGFERGYKPYGYDFETGYSQKYGQNFHQHNGKVSFCEYHYAIYEYTTGEYQLISLIDDPMWVDSGSSWKKEYNESAIACVFCGNFEIDNPSESMIEYFIDLFRPTAPLSWILHKNPGIKIIGHKDTGDATACPGQYLYTFLGRIRREIQALI
jgi:hypothetical protein